MFRKFHRSVPFITVALLGSLAMGCAGTTETEPKDPMAKLVDQRLDAALDELEATEVQREQIHALKDEMLAEVRQHRDERKAVHDEVRQLWLQEQVDPKQAHKLVDERIDKMRATAHKATDAVLELHGILTAEQRQQLAERMEERRSHWHRRWHSE